MQLRTDAFDVWVFCREDGSPRYLLLHTSQEKADRFFGGGRFWQIPTERRREGESMTDALLRCLRPLGLAPRSLWAVEHVYTIYNRRFDELEIIPAFAAEVEQPLPVPLTWEHAEARWLPAAECEARLTFRGLKEGLHWLRAYVTEQRVPSAELCLWTTRA